MKIVLMMMVVSVMLPLSAAEINPACKPETREDWSKPRSEWFTKVASQGKVGPILFIGDSITHLWEFSETNKYPGGKEIWAKTFKPLNATNFGIAGDRTEHVLRRITEGKQLEGINPKLIVLMIGTNNLHRAGKPDTVEQVVEGIELLVKTMREKLPDSNILLLGIFPRDLKASSPYRAKIKQINEQLAKLADGKKVYFMDIGTKFLNPDGSASKEILRDGIHLSPKGYQIWADVIMPEVLKLSGIKSPEPLKQK
jgi:lysophospholipase L1-like esterase